MASVVKNQFYNDGFIVIEKLLKNTDSANILSQCERIFENQFKNADIVKKKKVNKSFHDLLHYLYTNEKKLFFSASKQIQKIPLLFEIQTNKKIIDLLGSINISNPLISYTPLILFNSKFLNKYKTPPHQDWRSMQGSLDSVVIWVALQDVCDGFGNLEIIPRSHKFGLMKTKKDDWFRSISDKNIAKDSNFVSFKLNKGDAIIFSSFLIHRTGINESNDIRWSMQFRYNNLEEKSFIKRGYPDPYVHKPLHKILHKNFPSKSKLENFFQDINESHKK
tara:strand:+ start:74 stop:907 length:834 start_codon:yes stop_codon:yes gene_type:complete